MCFKECKQLLLMFMQPNHQNKMLALKVSANHRNVEYLHFNTCNTLHINISTIGIISTFNTW